MSLSALTLRWDPGQIRAEFWSLLRGLVLDVNAAFSSADWSQNMGALPIICVPGYLTSLVENYLSERILWYGTEEGSKKYIGMIEIQQRTILRPLLRNVIYN